MQVLEGARALLSAARPVVVFEHVAAAARLYGSQSAALWDLFGEAGYRVFAITGAGPIARSTFTENTTVVNWLATPA